MALPIKKCSVEGCIYPVWSKGLCQKHSPKSPLKKSTHTIYTGSEGIKNMTKSFKEEFDRIQKRDQFFNGIWITRMHRCEVCGAPLGHEPRSYMFDHLLEKNKYPELEFKEDNIALVCLECHDKKTRGFINDKYQELINFVITKYNIS